MENYNVLVALDLQARHREKLEAAAPGCSFVYCGMKGETEEQVAMADVIIGNVVPSYVKASPKLKLMQLMSAGADPYLPKGVLHESTVLTNSTGAYSKAVAEHGFASTLMLQKKLHLYRDAQLRAQWTDEGTVTSMADATVVVMGLGDIGCHYAKMAKAMGAYVIGVKRREGNCPEFVDELCTTDRADEVLPRADVIFSILPGTAQTYHYYSLERFKLMKPSAIFVNCGRGNAVSLSVLEQVMKEGIIASAAVDVTEIEPLPSESPLWAIPNLLITPHASGFFHLPETFERVVAIAAENLANFVNGRELRNVVDMETGYKK